MTPARAPSARVRLRRVEPSVRRALRGPCRVAPGSTLLLAASGGADSTALLVTLASLARELGLVLHAAHLHHGLRGREADADARTVRELCERFKIPLTSARWDCAARMRRRGLSGEAGLRTLRREWLAGVAHEHGACAIATAHTADDQLETLLMRLARGSGLTGMAGMRPRRGVWTKPLLGSTRAEIEADLRAQGIPWREDASNAEPTWLRNRVRHGAVPALLDALAVPPTTSSVRRAGLARRAAALAEELAGVDQLLDTLAARLLRRAGREAPAGARSVAALAGAPEPVRRRAISRLWRSRVGPLGPGLTARHLAAALRVIGSGAAPGARIASVDLPEGWTLVAARGMLHFAPPGPALARTADDTRRAGSPDARLAGGRRRTRRGPLGANPARRRATRAIV